MNLLSLNSGGSIGYVTNVSYTTNLYVTNLVTIITNTAAGTNLTGNFVLATTLTNVGNGPVWLATMDVNNDGRLDLLISDVGTSGVTILTNNGACGFGSYSFLSSPNLNASFGLTLADMNGDGKLDVICANSSSSGNVVVFTNNGNGSFNFSASVGVNDSYPRMVAAADFNGDGQIDLATDNGGSSTITVITNSPSGALTRSLMLTTYATSYYVAAGDFNHDGKTDLVGANYGSGYLTICTNTGNGQFISQNVAFAGITNDACVITTSIHGDTNTESGGGRCRGSAMGVITNNGSGGFGLSAILPVGSLPFFILATDINGDGKPDLISANNGSGNLTVWTNNGSGIFGSNTTYTVGARPSAWRLRT